MSLLLVTNPGCYPCDRAKTTLIHAKLAFSTTNVSVGIDMFPTLLLLDADDREVGRLIGPLQITLENILELADYHNITIAKRHVV